MFKKLCLFAALSTLSTIPSIQCSEQILETKSLIEHIDQQKKTIALEIKKTTAIGAKAVEHIQKSLGDAYKPLAAQVIKVISAIITSEEYKIAIDSFTDYQVQQITKGINFDDIGYPEVTPEHQALFTKIDNELNKAFSHLDEQDQQTAKNIEQLFDIFYVITSNNRGHMMLLEKLALTKTMLL
jgi:hypothetical protein